MAAQTTPLRAQDLTQQPIPKLLVHTQDQHHTSHPSNSSQAFTGLYGHWKEFEEEVRNTFHGQANNWTNAVIAYSQPSHFSNEQVYCNNEAGVLGRFQHHVGQVMTCVGHDLRMQLRFGDWHDTTAERKADTTIWDAAGKPVVAGEAKTPWTLDLQELIDPAFTTQARFEALFPGKIGQVADYMHTNSYRYGFLTTYHWTVFFKQIPLDPGSRWYSANRQVKPGPKQRILLYSNPICYSTPSRAMNNRTRSTYENMVSLRECMLYLMYRIAHEGGIVEDPGYSPWTRPKKGHVHTPKQEARFLKHPDDVTRGPGAPSSSGSTGNSSSGQQQQSYSSGGHVARYAPPGQQQQYPVRGSDGHYPSTGQKQQYIARSRDPLAERMGALNLHGSSAGGSSRETPKQAEVKWSRKRNTFEVTSCSGHVKKVDSYVIDENKNVWVRIDGVEYRGIVRA